MFKDDEWINRTQTSYWTLVTAETQHREQTSQTEMKTKYVWATAT